MNCVMSNEINLTTLMPFLCVCVNIRAFCVAHATHIHITEFPVYFEIGTAWSSIVFSGKYCFIVDRLQFAYLVRHELCFVRVI